MAGSKMPKTEPKSRASGFLSYLSAQFSSQKPKSKPSPLRSEDELEEAGPSEGSSDQQIASKKTAFQKATAVALPSDGLAASPLPSQPPNAHASPSPAGFQAGEAAETPSFSNWKPPFKECCKEFGQPFPPAQQLQSQASFTSQFARTIPASPAASLTFGTPSAAPGSFWGATPGRRANPNPLGTPKPSPFGSALRSGQTGKRPTDTWLLPNKTQQGGKRARLEPKPEPFGKLEVLQQSPGISASPWQKQTTAWGMATRASNPSPLGAPDPSTLGAGFPDFGSKLPVLPFSQRQSSPFAGLRNPPARSQHRASRFAPALVAPMPMGPVRVDRGRKPPPIALRLENSKTSASRTGSPPNTPNPLGPLSRQSSLGRTLPPSSPAFSLPPPRKGSGNARARSAKGTGGLGAKPHPSRVTTRSAANAEALPLLEQPATDVAQTIMHTVNSMASRPLSGKRRLEDPTPLLIAPPTASSGLPETPKDPLPDWMKKGRKPLKQFAPVSLDDQATQGPSKRSRNDFLLESDPCIPATAKNKPLGGPVMPPVPSNPTPAQLILSIVGAPSSHIGHLKRAAPEDAVEVPPCPAQISGCPVPQPGPSNHTPHPKKKQCVPAPKTATLADTAKDSTKLPTQAFGSPAVRPKSASPTPPPKTSPEPEPFLGLRRVPARGDSLPREPPQAQAKIQHTENEAPAEDGVPKYTFTALPKDEKDRLAPMLAGARPIYKEQYRHLYVFGKKKGAAEAGPASNNADVASKPSNGVLGNVVIEPIEPDAATNGNTEAAKAAAVELPPDSDEEGSEPGDDKKAEKEGAKEKAPANGAGGWDLGFLASNAQQSAKATKAVEEEQAKSNAPKPAPTFGGWGVDKPATVKEQGADSKPVPTPIAFGKGNLPVADFGDKGRVDSSTPAFSWGAAKDSETAKAAEEPAAKPVANGWGPAFLEQNKQKSSEATAAAAAEAEKAKGTSSGWGSAFLEQNKQKSSEDTAAAAAEVEKAKGGGGNSSEPLQPAPKITFGKPADAAAVADAGSGGSVWPNGFGSQPASGEAAAAPTFGIQPFKFGAAAGKASDKMKEASPPPAVKTRASSGQPDSPRAMSISPCASSTPEGTTDFASAPQAFPVPTGWDSASAQGTASVPAAQPSAAGPAPFAFPPVSTSAPPAPAFGASAPGFGGPATESGTNAFVGFGAGSTSSTAPSVPAFGSTTPAFGGGSVTFGSSAPASGEGSAPSFGFGSSATGGSAPAFAFGASVPAASGPSAPTFAFGASASASGGASAPGFAFGASAPAASGASAPGFTFGGAAPAVSGSSAPGFAFGASTPAAGGASGPTFGGFAAGNAASGGGFGVSAPGFGGGAAPAFGSSPGNFGGQSAPSGTPAFGSSAGDFRGQSAPSGAFQFGSAPATNPTAGPFGSAPAPSFGIGGTPASAAPDGQGAFGGVPAPAFGGQTMGMGQAESTGGGVARRNLKVRRNRK